MKRRAVPALGLAVSLMGGCLDLDFKSGNSPSPQSCTDPFQYSEPTDDSLFTGPLWSGAPDRGCPAVAKRDLIPGGSHASIYVRLTGKPLRSVSSTHPEVASFALTADPQRLLVTSGEVGTTELVAIADDGTELPHAPVRVSQCAKLELHRRGIGDTTLHAVHELCRAEKLSLGKALAEYSEGVKKDKGALLALLAPVQKAASKSPFVRKLVDFDSRQMVLERSGSQVTFVRP